MASLIGKDPNKFGSFGVISLHCAEPPGTRIGGLQLAGTMIRHGLLIGFRRGRHAASPFGGRVGRSPMVRQLVCCKETPWTGAARSIRSSCGGVGGPAYFNQRWSRQAEPATSAVCICLAGCLSWPGRKKLHHPAVGEFTVNRPHLPSWVLSLSSLP